MFSPSPLSRYHGENCPMKNSFLAVPPPSPSESSPTLLL
jgi:hypothetical protein